MKKKRELTVEVWLRAMERQIEYSKAIGSKAFLEEHSRRINMLGIEGSDFIYELGDVVYEMQIAKAWSDAGKQVYDFDQDFANSILGEKWVDLLPDCIANRPYDCFYMKLPCGKLNEGVVVSVVPTENILGFNPDFFPGVESGKGVYIGGDPASKDGARGRAVINTGEEILCLCSFAISKTFKLMTDDTPLDRYPADLVANGVAYLCSINADIVPSYKPQSNVRRNNAKRRSQATWHEVGYQIGSELRAYNHSVSHGENGGYSVRPHMRRAHWHHFWTGPRLGNRKLVLKWLAPTMVGGKPDTATLHKVG